MSEYEISVYTKVRETWVIEADSPEGAKQNWHEGQLVASECTEIEEVGDPEEVE